MTVSSEPEGEHSRVLATMTKNSAANLLRVGSSWVVVLFLPPLLVRVMDKQEYAVWLLLLQLAAYITFFDTGIQLAVSRYVARAEQLRDRNQLAGLMSSIGAILVAACLFAVLLTALTSLELPRLFSAIPRSIAPDARRALLIIGASLALTLPFTVMAGFFLGRQRNEVTAVAGSVGKFIGALGTAWAAYYHRGLVVMAVWIAAGYTLQSSIYLTFWRRSDSRGLLLPSNVQRSVTREFLIFCSSMMVAQFSSLLVTGMDMPVVAAFDFRSAAYYGVASILANVLAVPHSSIVSSLLPVLAGISAAENPRRLGAVLLKTTRFATAILCLITLPLLLLMPLILRIWVGSGYADHTCLLAETLVAAQFIRLTMFPYAMIGFAAGQQQRMLISPLAEGITNLACSLALVHFIGAEGVALGTLIGALVGVWLHLTASLRRTNCVQVDRAEFIARGVFKPLALALICGACAWPLQRIAPPAWHIPLAACAETALCWLLWRFVLAKDEHRQVKEVVSHFAARVGWAPAES